jgi:hypothetical protein
MTSFCIDITACQKRQFWFTSFATVPDTIQLNTENNLSIIHNLGGGGKEHGIIKTYEQLDIIKNYKVEDNCLLGCCAM